MRDVDQGKDGQLIAVSFSGNVLIGKNNSWQKQNITENRLRSIVYLNNQTWVASGDQNKTPGNYFISKDNGTTWQNEILNTPDIHRLIKYENNLWMVGKEGLIQKKKYN